jgi:predicted amino acid-binding ACT domain protein
VVEVVTSGKRLVPTEEWLGFANETTARLLRMVLATQSLKKDAELGRIKLLPIIAEEGILALEDVQALESDRMDNLLEELGCSSLEDLYVAVGGGAVRLNDFQKVLCKVGITREQLGWVTVNITADPAENRPGVLARLAGLVSKHNGNILRSVNNTLPEGGFTLRLVVIFSQPEMKDAMEESFRTSGIVFKSLQVV